MKKLKAEIEAEKTAVPNSLEAAFERLQGKAFVDVEKNDKLAETRQEANAVNSLLRAQGCTPVDIDRRAGQPIAGHPTERRSAKGMASTTARKTGGRCAKAVDEAFTLRSIIGRWGVMAASPLAIISSQR